LHLKRKKLNRATVSFLNLLTEEVPSFEAVPAGALTEA
jgi:hypothetical protein